MKLHYRSGLFGSKLAGVLAALLCTGLVTGCGDREALKEAAVSQVVDLLDEETSAHLVHEASQWIAEAKTDPGSSPSFRSSKTTLPVAQTIGSDVWIHLEPEPPRMVVMVPVVFSRWRACTVYIYISPDGNAASEFGDAVRHNTSIAILPTLPQ